jgi:hypothetical protein
MSDIDPSEDAPKPKSYRETAYAYHGLHDAEKDQLLSTATSMKAAVDALMLLVMGLWGYSKPGFQDFAACFESAAQKVQERCAEIRDAHMYWYAPKTHVWCRDKLDEGMRLLQASQAKLVKAGRADEFAQIKKEGEHCQQCFDAYANAWSDIRAFDHNNTLAWLQRRRGHHAFEQQASMADMLLLLQQMQSLSAPITFIE